MEKYINLRDLFKHADEYYNKDITVNGWIKTNRDSKNFGFIVLSDGTCFETLQVVYDDKLSNFKDLTKLRMYFSPFLRIFIEPISSPKRE